MNTVSKSWLRQAISDEAGLADMAYIAIGALTVAAIVALAFIFAMSAISYSKCMPVTTVQTQAKDSSDSKSVAIVPCNFDPLPIGQAAGLIFGAFGALIGSLAGYMAATKRRVQEQPRAPGA